MTPDEFVVRWEKSGGAELANAQSFLKELCDLIGVDQPNVTTTDKEQNRYVFEKSVVFNNGDGTFSHGRIDLYRTGCFVLESKQGSECKAAELAEVLATKTKQAAKHGGTASRGTLGWEKAMRKAREQAKGYAEAIPDEWPPFLIVVDVGHCFDLHADFTGTGKNYLPFPDPRSFRIPLGRLRDESIRNRLKLLWTDPHGLDPSKRAAEVSRDIATRLAKLAKSLEAEHDPEVVAGFLMRCLFTMFAEDVDLIRKGGFTELLLSLRFELDNFAPMVEGLWSAMDEGKFSQFLREKVRHFNGKFFKDKTALPVTKDQLDLLVEASEHDWRQVEPAIFGTLLERALDPVERHKLGAHYTPRAYVERLVMPTIIEPLREQWDATYAAAIQLDEEGKRKQAVKLIQDFHGQLCETRVLDPACGSGNFLYVAMELMKRLEGEVVVALTSFDADVLPGITIDPHQFLGIEINPRAAALAELVLWIGFIQWHVRTRNEVAPPEPILKDYKNIECRDAVLTWDSIEPVFDGDGQPVTRWDGRTTKPHPVTGEEVPDESARVQELRYINPKKADWPETDYIVGNPPFLGQGRMRDSFGNGYTEALRTTYEALAASTDYVLYWWDRAAISLSSGEIRRFGLVTTNSISQKQNRKMIENHLVNSGISLVVVLADHPWVDSATGASVRIAMTVAELGQIDGVLSRPIDPKARSENNDTVALKDVRGNVRADLTVGVNVSDVPSLSSNVGLSSMGVKLHGARFEVPAEKLSSVGGSSNVVRRYLGGRDLAQKCKERHVIDFFGLTLDEAREQFPAALQWVVQYVKPHRDESNDAKYRQNWWLFGRPRPEMRVAVASLKRFVVTPRTAKHRFFVFLTPEYVCESEVIIFSSSEAFVLGCLSSRAHVTWSLRRGSRLGAGNDPRYNNSLCFDSFPFPAVENDLKHRIAELAERLDAHRKRQQEQHSELTMTGMYNVLEKLRSGDKLTAKEHRVHEQGLVSVLKQIHDDLDAAVFDAYDWPHDLEDEEILQRLVDLNRERADEESRGIIRWLRPDFQNPNGETQTAFAEEGKKAKSTKATSIKIKKQRWPKGPTERMVAVHTALMLHARPANPKEISAYYTRANNSDIESLLATLVAVGSIRQLDDGRFAVGA